MIKALNIRNPEATPVTWWSKVPALKEFERLEFNPKGLTVLWGPNGVGKSTIITALARLTHCEQGGVPRVTSQSYDQFRERSREQKALNGLELETDGQPSFYFNPEAQPGLVGGLAGFDSDFFTEGVSAVFLRRLSSGQQNNANTERIFKAATTVTATDLSGLTRYRDQTDTAHLKAATQGILKNLSGKAGLKTLLLDEPCRSLDIATQVTTWKVFGTQTKFQIIVATHSPFALWLPGATYVDLQKGYLEECRASVRGFMSTIPKEAP